MWPTMGRCHLLSLVTAVGLCFAPMLAAASNPGGDIQCRNPQGRPVEWFIMYKAPKTAATNTRTRRYDLQGSEYGYVDSGMPTNSQAFADGVDGIYSDRNNPLANSLERLVKRQKIRAEKELVYIVYNDQPPPALSNSSSNAHTKGIILFGQQSGIWILHSVPRFPEKLFSGKYSFPANARENAQSILCITFDIDKLNTIAAHLRKQRPNMYAANAPTAVRNRYQELDKLLDKKFSHTAPYFINETLPAIKGTPFVAFAKGGPLNEDVYSKIIAPALKTDLFVESWRNGRGGKLPPDCFDKYKTTDIQKIALKVGDKTMRWNSEEDHSKWTISDNGDWTCIGSINRMLSQLKRGGETLCLSHKGVQRLFASAIVEFAPCNIDGIQTRGRTALIEDLIRSEQTDEDKAEEADGQSGSAEEQPSPINRTPQTGLSRMWEKQKRKIVVELEGIRAAFG